MFFLKKLDWYILKSFLSTFFFSIILFTLISTVIDMSEKTDDFAKSGLTAGEIFMQYYIGFIPYILALLFPLFVFISVIFFTSKLANRTEIVAIIASGVSLQRILVPYFIGGSFLGIILWIGNLYIIPKANELRTTFESKYTKGLMFESSSRSIYMRVDSFSYCGIRYYDTLSKSGGSFFLQQVRNNKVIYNLRADNIIWDTSKRKWKLSNSIERQVDSMGERVNYMQERFKSFNFKPADLKRDEFLRNRLTSPELNRVIALEKMRGSETVKELMMEDAHRTATPVAVLILTIIGAILASRKIRGGSGLHMAYGILICAVFILTDRFSTIFSTKGNLNPYLAAWIPNIVFCFITVGLYKKSPK